MRSTERLCEIEPHLIAGFEDPDEQRGDGGDESGDSVVSEERMADWDDFFEDGALGLRADGRRKRADDDDSDLGFEDEDYDDTVDDDGDDDLDDDFDDEEDADDEFEDDFLADDEEEEDEP
jgi:hypothetical protein